ncbi:MAG TPA: HAD family phosphatase [Sedimentisphaerales bacterium]|nr:HAD family phosphatase [Sedimentisphaerales bacterium]
MPKLYGLIFDVDGVIADTEPATAEATIKVFVDLFGIKGVKPEDFEAGVGRGAEAYIKAAAKVHGLELTDEQLGRAMEMRERNFVGLMEQSPAPAFGGVLKLMGTALARPDFRLAIATSSSRRMSEAALKGAKVPYHKMAYVTGSEVRNKKPHPDLFLLAAERMGIPPANCVVIEDSPGGVEAAKAAGARCIAVTNTTTGENLRPADLICDSLEQVDLRTVVNLVSPNGT